MMRLKSHYNCNCVWSFQVIRNYAFQIFTTFLLLLLIPVHLLSKVTKFMPKSADLRTDAVSAERCDASVTHHTDHTSHPKNTFWSFTLPLCRASKTYNPGVSEVNKVLFFLLDALFVVVNTTLICSTEFIIQYCQSGKQVNL